MDACNLPPYKPSEGCPACGGLAEDTVPSFDFDTGHIGRRCYQCGFNWEEAPLWDPNRPPILRRTQADKECPACGFAEIEVVYLDNPTAVEIKSIWRAGDEALAYLRRALHVDTATLSPFLGLRCKRCSFVWPELPLNRPDVTGWAVFPPHTCTA